MNMEWELSDQKTYATEDNARKAFQKLVGDLPVRFMIVQNPKNHRYQAVAMGEKAIEMSSFLAHSGITVIG